MLTIQAPHSRSVNAVLLSLHPASPRDHAPCKHTLLLEPGADGLGGHQVLQSRKQPFFGNLHRASFAGVPADKAVRVRLDRGARRGKVFASRTSCPTFRIFSSNDSRASFCRISGFISLAASTYAVAECFPALFCRGRPAGKVVRCAPCPSAVRRLSVCHQVLVTGGILGSW